MCFTYMHYTLVGEVADTERLFKYSWWDFGQMSSEFIVYLFLE